MAHLLETNNRRLVADTYHQLKNYKSKVQRKAADIGFVKKALHLKVTPTFAKVRGQFKSGKDKTLVIFDASINVKIWMHRSSS